MNRIGLFLGAGPADGGTFQYNQAMLDAVASLPKNQYEVTVAYVDPLWKGYLSGYSLKTINVQLGFWGRAFGKLWRACGLPLKWWREISPYFHPVAQKLIAEKCNLWIFPSQDVWSYQVKVPALAAIHDLMHRYERRFPEVSSEGEYEKREKHYSNMCKEAGGILVDSVVGLRQVHESYGVPKEKIFVLPYIPPRYVYENKVREDFDEKYNLPGKFIFYPAQYWEHKNHIRLIKAVNTLKEEIPDIQLVLVGSRKNNYETAYRTVEGLNLQDNVHFMGYVPDNDIPEFYRRARALVMPTFFGPTNIPPLEAFVLGCPVAISGIYGIPEQVGDAALLFNPESVEEITGCIRRLWINDDLCAELAEKGQRRAAAWGPEQFNRRVQQIIERIV